METVGLQLLSPTGTASPPRRKPAGSVNGCRWRAMQAAVAKGESIRAWSEASAAGFPASLPIAASTRQAPRRRVQDIRTQPGHVADRELASEQLSSQERRQ